MKALASVVLSLMVGLYIGWVVGEVINGPANEFLVVLAGM